MVRQRSTFVPFVLAASLAAVSGCGLEAPEAPSFSTTLNVPLGEETYTGLDMANDLEAVEGDSLEAGPLTIEAGEDLAAVYLEEGLRCTLLARRFEASLAEIDFTMPEIESCGFDLGELLPFIPPAGVSLPIDPFLFEPGAVDLGVFSEFEEVQIAGGQLWVRLTNRLPVPIGGAAVDGHAIEVALLDLSVSPSREVVRLTIDGEIAPQQTAVVLTELAGVTIGNHLAAAIRGWSPGSAGVPVEVTADQGIDLAFAFSDCRIARLTGRPPALEFAHQDEVALDERFRISEARIASGEFEWMVRSELPVAAEILLSCPTLRRDREPIELHAQLPPGGEVLLAVSLAGATLTGEQSVSVPWELSVQTAAGDESCTVEVGQEIAAECAASEIRFDSVRGVLEEVTIPVPATEAEIEFPEEIDGILFAAAEMQLRVCNRTQVSLRADLALVAVAGAETLSVPFSVTVEPGSDEGPTETIVMLDESNSNILDLLNLRPERVWVDGQIVVGDGSSEIEVSASDFIDGSFALTVPMKLVLASAHHEGDPFVVDIDEEGRAQIADHLEEAAIATRIANHFPAGVRVRLHLARSEGALFVNDELVIDLGEVAPAPTDPATGRVSAPIDQALDVYLPGDDVAVFALPGLHGAIEVTLVGDDEEAVEIWTTDYATIGGMVSLQYRVE
ncbi:MAG: hypothetical protein KAY32_05380 [Candidatus Eisenbacteria sp.]|nr:hypothetical protein [Candidatus Eisenbacteria bacterium]